MIIKGNELVQRVTLELVRRSQMFKVTPLPDDKYEVVVRPENRRLLNLLVKGELGPASKVESKIVRMKNGSVEIVLIERDGFQVRAALNDDGSICTEYIRVVDTKKRGKELAYWHHDEFMESTDPFDPSTALAAAFSVIELVYSGQYPPREEKNG